MRLCVLTIVMSLLAVPGGAAQEDSRIYVGGLFGISTLSADAEAITTPTEAALSMYKPENGLAVNLFAGFHLAQYFSVQANWMWNRNEVTLVSAFIAPEGDGFYEQRRHSHQHALVLDGLIYFRRLDTVRPYLGTGLSVVHFSANDVARSSANGLDPPRDEIVSTRVGLRSHVGIDVRVARHLSFRYSFSETITGNPISPSLTPTGQRRLANFQNLFGFVGRF